VTGTINASGDALNVSGNGGNGAARATMARPSVSNDVTPELWLIWVEMTEPSAASIMLISIVPSSL